MRGVDGPVSTSEPAALTVCPPPRPASAKLSPALQVAQGSDAEPGWPGSSLSSGWLRDERTSDG